MLDDLWEGLLWVGCIAIIVASYWFVFIYLWGVINGGDPSSWLP